jgi:hypothetical protein
MIKSSALEMEIINLKTNRMPVRGGKIPNKMPVTGGKMRGCYLLPLGGYFYLIPIL